jgi:hypothetical protein
MFMRLHPPHAPASKALSQAYGMKLDIVYKTIVHCISPYDVLDKWGIQPSFGSVGLDVDLRLTLQPALGIIIHYTSYWMVTNREKVDCIHNARLCSTDVRSDSWSWQYLQFYSLLQEKTDALILRFQITVGATDQNVSESRFDWRHVRLKFIYQTVDL